MNKSERMQLIYEDLLKKPMALNHIEAFDQLRTSMRSIEQTHSPDSMMSVMPFQDWKVVPGYNLWYEHNKTSTTIISQSGDIEILRNNGVYIEQDRILLFLLNWRKQKDRVKFAKTHSENYYEKHRVKK